jgi:plasmid replication initiation protein
MPNPNNKSATIRKSNELIEARYKLSLAEQRLILLLASEISPDDKDFKKYQITVADFVRMFGLESSNAMYKEVQKAAKELVGKRLDLSKNGEEIYTTWLSYVKYVDGSGLVNLEFHSSLKPYLLQLKKHFTQYNLGYVIDFTCQYSVRFYELLKMDAYKSKNGQFEKAFEIEELRFILGLEEKDYPLFADFKRRAIDPSVKEINEKTDLDITEVNYGKTGRKITRVTFSVVVRSKEDTLQRQAALGQDATKPEKDAAGHHPVVTKLIALGFSEELAKSYKNKHGVKKIERNIAYTLAKKHNGAVKDVPAYLNKAIENDLGGAWDVKHQQDTEKIRQRETQAQQQQAAEKKSQQEANEKYKKAFQAFQALPEAAQQAIKDEFIGATDPITAGEIRKAQGKGKDMLASALIAANFKKFIIEQKGL